MPLGHRHSHGATGFASFHSPRRDTFAPSSSRAYSSRSCGACSFAYSRYHHAIPALICIGLLTIPELIFGGFGDSVYAHFAKILSFDRVSFLPISLTGLCSGCGLFLPVKLKHTR